MLEELPNLRKVRLPPFIRNFEVWNCPNFCMKKVPDGVQHLNFMDCPKITELALPIGSHMLKVRHSRPDLKVVTVHEGIETERALPEKTPWMDFLTGGMFAPTNVTILESMTNLKRVIVPNSTYVKHSE
jgi:hypothetical protein